MKARKIISAITLCLLVLTSSSNFVIGMHLCGGHIQDVAFLGQAERCVSEKKMPPCHRQESKPCCEDQTIVHKGDDVKASINQVNFAPEVSIEIDLPSFVITEVIPSSPAAKLEYYNYDPPLPSTDLVVALQVFLI